MPSASRRDDERLQWQRDAHRFNGVLDQHITASAGGSMSEGERILLIDSALGDELDDSEQADFGLWARWYAISARLRQHDFQNPRRSPREQPPAAAAAHTDTAAPEERSERTEAAPEPENAAAPAPHPPPEPMPMPAAAPAAAAAEEEPLPITAHRPTPAPEEKQTRVTRRKVKPPPRGRAMRSRLNPGRKKRKLKVE